MRRKVIGCVCLVRLLVNVITGRAGLGSTRGSPRRPRSPTWPPPLCLASGRSAAAASRRSLHGRAGSLAGLPSRVSARRIPGWAVSVADWSADGLGRLVIARQLDVQVRARARADPRVKTLTSLPGVGQFTALVMVAEIGDITRFASARKLASWAGLTPTVRGSDRTVRHGHISKQGSVWLRWV